MRLAHVALCCSLLLAGCANLMKHKKPDDVDLAWDARRALLEEVDRFTLQARVSSGGVLGMRGNLNWTQLGDTFDLHVAGPFGAGAMAIRGTPADVEIRTRNNVYHTSDPDRFLHDKLGWAFPVHGLRYWALGLPSPESDAQMELDANGRILSMTQDGWDVAYNEYQRVAGLDLPRQFELANSEVRIRVVVDTWSGLPVRP
jgi:outer membrane lipoprotein LolB